MPYNPAKRLNPKYWAIAIIIMVSFGAYFNTLWNDFVYDDEYQVLKNLWIKDVRHIPEIFTAPVWAFESEGPSNYYRPLIHIIYMIDYHLLGLQPWGYHLTNIIFHAGVSILVFLIAVMLFNLRKGNTEGHSSQNLIFAFSAGILFAVHPIHTEVVAWVAGIPELSFTFFYLLSFYLYTSSDRGRKEGRKEDISCRSYFSLYQHFARKLRSLCRYYS